MGVEDDDDDDPVRGLMPLTLLRTGVLADEAPAALACSGDGGCEMPVTVGSVWHAME
jgi:hypothetical protein